MALTIIAVAVVAAVAVSGLRILAMPAARRILRETPLLAGATALAVVAAVVAVIVAVRIGPTLLLPLAGAAALGWLALRWRARPSFGRRRGLPPGSLSLRASLEAIVDRSFLRRSFERYGPVFKTAQFHRPAVCVLGLERGRELLRLHSESIVPAPLGRDRTVPRNNISGATTWATWFLAQSPDWLGVVREAEGGGDGRSDPATAAVLETLRLARSEYVYHIVERPIDVEGLTVPVGWLVRICVAESHLLDPPFADPLQFEPERHLRNRYGPADFAPFGLDAHGCLGARLTIELARSFVEALAGYTPVIEEIGPPTRGTRHWSHWSIGSSFRLALAPA